eukprot:scaffold2.g6985.t1
MLSGPVAPTRPVVAAAVAGVRHMSGLSDILAKEFEYEKTNYEQPEELAGGPPAPFTLTETKGDTLMTLAREYKGEQVAVEVMVNDQPEEEAYEAEEGQIEVDVGCAFTASVTRGDQALVFECKSDGTYLQVLSTHPQVLHVSLEPASGEIDDSAYTGPVYEELDEELQQRLVEYLAERGLGEYLLRLVHDKEQRWALLLGGGGGRDAASAARSWQRAWGEYMYWLERMRAFVGTA